VLLCFCLAVNPQPATAANIGYFSDVLSDSGSSQQANHTFKFRPTMAITPGSYLEVDFPADFIITEATSTFLYRSVELYINV
jgi:hypothetical protein